jgi:hypothetical protein
LFPRPKDRALDCTDLSSDEPAFLIDPVTGPGLDDDFVDEEDFLRSDNDDEEEPDEGSAEVRL